MKTLWSLRAGAKRSTVAHEYTRETVRYWLREDLDSVQARRVRSQVERVGSYLYDSRLKTRYRGLESYQNRLPSILSMYLRGLSIEEIAAHYRPVFTAYGVDRSLDILADHIAYRLNRGE